MFVAGSGSADLTGPQESLTAILAPAFAPPKGNADEFSLASHVGAEGSVVIPTSRAVPSADWDLVALALDDFDSWSDIQDPLFQLVQNGPDEFDIEATINILAGLPRAI
jgi:hypothetical protein